MLYRSGLHRKTKINYWRYLRNSKQLYLPSISPAGGGLVTATFANLPYIYQIFKTSITNTRTLALSLILDENKDKVSEKSHKIISLVSYQLAAPFRQLQAKDQTHLNDALVHRLAEGTAALMYTALLSSQVATACLHVSDCSSHESRSSRKLAK